MPAERDYIDRTIATVRNHREADNCWPQWANIFADEIERLRAELQAAQEREKALREALEEGRPYVYGVTRDDQQWRAETAFGVLGRVDAALAAQRTEEARDG